MNDEPIYEGYSQEVSDDDKLWAALSWLPWIGFWVALIVLLTEKKDNTFPKYHAVLSIVADVAILISLFVLIGFCVGPIIFFVRFYWAYEAYQGNYVEIPLLTDFVKNQGWV